MSGDKSQPANLEQVLRLAVASSSTSEEPASSMQPMTAERTQFLQTVLSSMSGTNHIQRMKMIIAHCCSSESSKENLCDALEELSDWCEDIDMACDFHKVGGFIIFTTLLRHEDDGVKSKCAELIANLCQNNPYCQEKLLETNEMNRLMEMTGSPRETPLIRTKALYALSGLLRGNMTCQEHFVKSDGFSLLLKSMQRDDNKICTKASFLLMSLMRDQPKFKDELAKMGFVEQLTIILTKEHKAEHEHVMAALLELCTGCQLALHEAQRSEFGLQDLLASRISLLHEQPESEEELDYMKRLKQLLSKQLNDDVIDR
ncbi:hsp70-binding protein 1-like [Watersipora subatra]|uniref:hsp70-binding protein 1-like n=1 Tax=Watersipora subatra TaxID=2589382 RepID=UPI00355C5C33